MKKPITSLLILLTVAIVLGTVCFLYLRNGEAHPFTLVSVPQVQTDGHTLVDLNTADLETLCTLPGIGQKLAQNILDYRSRVGEIRDYSELLNIDGIGTGRLDNILPYITLGG